MRTSLSGSLSGPQRFRFQARSRAGRGFSLIEMIGVLAIMGILAGMLAPPILRQLRQAQVANEDANLEEVARAMAEGIKATGTIPNPTVSATAAGGWVNIASNYTSLGTNQLLNVFGTNAATQRRAYLSGDLSTYLTANGYSTPPGGWPTNAFPANNQLLLMSSSREDLVLPTPVVGNVSPADFDRLRNWTKTFANGFVKVPDLTTSFDSGWQPATGQPDKDFGQFLHVKTIDLRPFFCFVQLEDTRSPPRVGNLTAGSGYIGYGPILTNVFGVSVAVSFGGATNTNTSIISASIASSPGRIVWANSPTNNALATELGTNIVIAGTAPGGTDGSVNLLFPATPSFALQNNPLVRMDSQDLAFYVIKGTSLKLGDATLTNQKSISIQADSSYRFINGNWQQVD